MTQRPAKPDLAPRAPAPKSLSSLLYISRSTIPPDRAEASLRQIVAESLIQNRTKGLTGALLFTGAYFAQVLEGDQPAIDWVMAAIFNDPRHDDVMLVDWSPITERRFAAWTLAYFGPSQFVSDHVTRLLSDRTSPRHDRAVEWLNELLWAFSADAGPA